MQKCCGVGGDVCCKGKLVSCAGKLQTQHGLEQPRTAGHDACPLVQNAGAATGRARKVMMLAYPHG